jgi:hypothetical protein
MVGELGGHRLVRSVIRIFAGGDELRRHLPDRVMAQSPVKRWAKENGA